MDIKILVATHKKYRMPDDKIYMPLHVGREGKENLGYTGDNTGDNISSKNANFCELTGLYWAWKNLKCDYIGLCHYRRYFSRSAWFKRVFKKDKMDLILSGKEVERLMEDYDIILPRKRNYFIETIESHYKHAHHAEDLEKVRNIINEKYGEYSDSFNEVMSGRTLHLFNMFIMKKSDFDCYCKWLFSILFELEKQVDISNYDNYQKRIFGFLSERLFNVWVLNQQFDSLAIPVVNLEKIDWGKKIKEFIKRKYRQ